MPTINETESNEVKLQGQDDFDNKYNGLKILPKKIRAEDVDSLKCQCILRAIILRLEPVKNLRKAVAEVSSALYTMQVSVASNDDQRMERLIQVNQEYWSGPTPQKLVRFDAVTPLKSRSSTEDTSFKKGMELSAETMAVINTPKSKSKNKTNGLNKDAIFNITSDCVAKLDGIYKAVRELEQYELHELSLKDKILLLKVLCDACYDSKRIRELLETHADERQTKIQEMNRIKREQQAKMKEISAGKKQIPIEACRKINMEAARKKESAAASSKSKTKKGNPNTTSTNKDNFDPSNDQLNAMIDDLIMLEAFGIDTVIEDIAIEDASSDDEDDKNDIESNEEGEEDEGVRLSRRQAVSSRAKALDRKKIIAERVHRNSLILTAYEKITYAMETKNERDLRGAIKAAERAGFKGINDNDEVFCTQMLKQAS